SGPAERRARVRSGRRAGRSRDTGGPGRPQPAPGGRVPRADRWAIGRGRSMKDAAGGPQAPGRTPHGHGLAASRRRDSASPGDTPGTPDGPPALHAGAPPARPSDLPAGAPPARRPAREASVASAPGYTARRTLPLRVEAIRRLRRRRTMVAALILLALPWILVGAFELGGPPQPGSGAPELVDLATTGGLNFAAFSFFASVGFLLVV